MTRALINPELCLNCKECKVADMCPDKAVIREEPSDKPWIDFMKCRGCMDCTANCNNKAVLEDRSSGPY